MNRIINSEKSDWMPNWGRNFGKPKMRSSRKTEWIRQATKLNAKKKKL
jgi:hypothetical protein